MCDLKMVLFSEVVQCEMDCVCACVLREIV
jgi:hypothetical protein